MKYKASKRFYKGCYLILGPVLRLFRPFRAIGRENMIEGAALVCANHSAMVDPLFIGMAFDKNTNIHVFAKAELYKVPFVSMLIQKLGTISVDRSTADITSIKTALSYLKNGEKVVVFPEGTRRAEHDDEAAKTGAVKLAERAAVPILPVFIPRKKPFFKRCTIVFGEPYYIEKQSGKRTPEDYAELSKDLMRRIHELGVRN